MQKIIVGMLLSVFVTIFTAFSAEAEMELTLFMSASPANPIVGEPVVWTVKTFGGTGQKQYTWNSDPAEMPQLYSWSGEYPYYETTSISNTYTRHGMKYVTVTVHSSEGKSTTRTLSIDVAEGRITLLSPNGNEKWEVGKTYEIKWSTEGVVNPIQIGLWDPRYNSEVGNAGEEILVFSAQNTGSFVYTVPPPRTDGISGGNLGGKNYKVSVGGFNPSFSDFSDGFFTIVE